MGAKLHDSYKNAALQLFEGGHAPDPAGLSGVPEPSVAAAAAVDTAAAPAPTTAAGATQGQGRPTPAGSESSSAAGPGINPTSVPPLAAGAAPAAETDEEAYDPDAESGVDEDDESHMESGDEPDDADAELKELADDGDLPLQDLLASYPGYAEAFVGGDEMDDSEGGGSGMCDPHFASFALWCR